MGQCVSTSACHHNRSVISSSRHAKDHHHNVVAVSFKSRKTASATRIIDRKKKSEAASGCYGMIKEQRSRLYIIRKCVIMLIFWHRYRKSIWYMLSPFFLLFVYTYAILLFSNWFYHPVSETGPLSFQIQINSWHVRFIKGKALPNRSFSSIWIEEFWLRFENLPILFIMVEFCMSPYNRKAILLAIAQPWLNHFCLSISFLNCNIALFLDIFLFILLNFFGDPKETGLCLLSALIIYIIKYITFLFILAHLVTEIPF